MSFFGLNFGQNADIDIILDDQENRKMADIRDENGRKERLYLFYDGESVSGKVNVTLHRKTNRLEHQGIKIEFIGQIELYYDRGNHHEFLSLVKELARPGELTQNTAFDFEFNQVEKPYECYTGANVRLRYFLRVTIVRRLTDMVKELDLLVHTLATYPDLNNPIKMEVGIEECLHIEFEYNKSKYHLKDVIVGKIYFLLVRIKIKHMEVAIIKRETTGSGPNTFHDNETIAKYEIMDGAPVKGESIPIRVFLAGYDLTPTMRDINKKFSVRYYLNLVLVDEEERRYFKQQEITLWRKAERPRKPYSIGGGGGPLPLHHAMARHQGGDFPSQNIRTAPTPSNPNTPVVSDPSYGHLGGGSQYSGEEEVRDQTSSEQEVVNSPSPHQMICEDDDNNSEPEIVTHDDVKPEVVTSPKPERASPKPEVAAAAAAPKAEAALSNDLSKVTLTEKGDAAEKVAKRNDAVAGAAVGVTATAVVAGAAVATSSPNRSVRRRTPPTTTTDQNLRTTTASRTKTAWSFKMSGLSTTTTTTTFSSTTTTSSATTTSKRRAKPLYGDNAILMNWCHEVEKNEGKEKSASKFRTIFLFTASTAATHASVRHRRAAAAMCACVSTTTLMFRRASVAAD